MNCHGYLIGMLKSTGVCTKRQQKDEHSPKTFTNAMFLKALICHHTSALLDFSGWWGYSKQSNPAGSGDFYFCLDILRLGGHIIVSEQQELMREGEKTDVNMYMCWKFSPVLSSSLSSVLLLQHWSNPVLISLDRLS